ncbi:FtsX-like permease family protein [Peterkaempfera sp. SMS 1(5)a]|uniref:FtsX-like permease family protein n=1 Tax=Peterkaempfera podocarpi TaxID=3232308 RepID=UPI00366CC290
MDQATDQVVLQVTDRYDMHWTLPTIDVPTDGRPHSVRADLAAAAGDGTPAYPLTLSGLTVTTPEAQVAPVQQDFVVRAVRADATPASVPRAFAWKASYDDGMPDGTVVAAPDGVPAVEGSPSRPIALTLDPGITTLRPDRGSLGTLPGVADRRFLESSGAHVGNVVPLRFGSGVIRVRITAAVSALPGTGAAAEQGLTGRLAQSGDNGSDGYGGALLVDLAAFDRRADAALIAPILQHEWWLDVSGAPGAAERTAAAIRARPGRRSVFVRDQVTAELLHDPLGTGPESALLAASVLAALLAAVGFGAEASGAVRRRAGEAAVLRALGAPRRLVARSTAAVLALPVLLGVATGALLGEALTRLVVPLLVLTPQATPPVPAVQVLLPAAPLALLLVGVGGVPLLVAALSGRRGGDPARSLRRSEES